jgi:hypothetical protein
MKIALPFAPSIFGYSSHSDLMSFKEKRGNLDVEIY